MARFVLKMVQPKHWSVRELGIDKKRAFPIQMALDTSGYFYYQYVQIGEKLRTKLFNTHRKFENFQILFEILKHSSGLLIFLVVLCVLFVSNQLYSINIFWLEKKDIVLILTVYAGGAIALLGIIFALYSVGFQTTTEKFSTKVTDYLNSEQVGRFFFKLLAFSALFSIVNLILQFASDNSLMHLFYLSTFLTASSLLSVLIFKDDYITKLKPQQVFKRLYRESVKIIKLVNLYNQPDVKSFSLYHTKNIRSFKLYHPIHSSWSLIGYFQNQLSDMLDIGNSLYMDLIKDRKYEDATFGIMSFAYLLAEYVSIKHFIDKKFGWWFPDEQELVKSSPHNIPLKLNYESRGIGRLGQTIKNTDWVEDRILSFFKQIQENTDFQKFPLLGNSLINAYEITLAGKFSKTSKGYEKNLLGVIENQIFNLSEKVYQQFIDLGSKLARVEECNGNYINASMRIKTAMLDGLSVRSFPGKLVDWKPDITKKLNMFTSGGHITVDSERIISWKLPKYFHETFVDILGKLSVEEEIERIVITDPEWLTKEVFELIKKKENEVIRKRIDLMIPSMAKLSAQSEDEVFKSYIGGAILSTFNQLIDQNRWKTIQTTVQKYRKELFKIFIVINTKQFVEAELRDQIDHGIFSALVKRNKVVFYFYLGLFYLTQSHLRQVLDKKDNQAILKTLRRPLMLGGLAYLVSELDQDSYYISTFTRQIEYLSNTQNIEDLYKQLIDIKKKGGFTFFNVGLEEANRYRHFYRDVINSISELPKDYITHGSSLFGMSSTETVKHPSEFVRKMASFRFSDMDECQEGYIEWLKKRRQVQNLIKVLKLKIKNEK